MDAAQMEEPQVITPIIETMKSWLAGETVWPYDKIIKIWGPDFESYHRRWSIGTPILNTNIFARTHSLYMTRRLWIRMFGFAIPCAELLDELAKHKHVVEVGAGSGYMTMLMRNIGIEVVGSDVGPNGYGFETGLYDDDQQTLDAKTTVQRFPSSAVFCSWPSLDEVWFRQMLKAMEVGQTLIVIREDACAEPKAWEYIDDCFSRETIIRLPTFEFISDYAAVYVKQRQSL